MPNYNKHIYDEIEDWTPDEAAKMALDELGGWEASLDELETRLKQLLDMVESKRERIRDRMAEVEAARDDFLEYYAQLDAAGDPDIRAPMPKGPRPDPGNIRAFVDSDLEQLVGTLEEMLDSYANVKACQNPKCGRAFFASGNTREKLYCSTYCRVQAHRARQKAEANRGYEQGRDAFVPEMEEGTL